MRQYSGSWTLSQVAQAISDQNWPGIAPPNVEYLVVAGGGGGGSRYGGAGGAGGLLAGFAGVVAGSAITVTVGAGGNGNTNTGAAGNGNDGSNSVFSTITATGGGRGAGNTDISYSGGSGGGASYRGPVSSGISGQGNRGGAAGVGGDAFYGGGGGGAGTVGFAGTNTRAGNGGAGIASDISGTRTTYAGGGGGGAYPDNNTGAGGAGGGGNGAGSSNTGTAGTSNTGGGGGGGSGTAGGYNGGSGIVIISYPDTYRAAQATTGSPTITTSGSGSLLFNGSGQYLSFADSNAFYFDADYTVEAWVYTDGGTTSSQAIVNQRSSGSVGMQFLVNWTGSVYQMGGWVSGSTYLSGGNSIPASTWTHLAWTRQGSTVRTFINGVLNQTVTFSTSVDVAAVLTVGGDAAGYGQDFKGYLSNVRLVKGIAVYTGAFTPPLGPLSATQSAGGSNISAITGTQTSLLLNAVSGSQFTDASTNSFTTSVVGSPNWNSSSPFATGGGFKRRVYIYNSSGSITF